MRTKIRLKVFHGREASVNAYIFYDDSSVILVDCLRNTPEARQLAEEIRSMKRELLQVLITHGHSDHYLGMSVLQKEFPETPIVVARKEIRDDIIAFSEWMAEAGWLMAEPEMLPKCYRYPNGFDYLETISVLGQQELQLTGGAKLHLRSDYHAAECSHLTTMYSEDLNAFFTGDFCYHQVHIWLAVERDAIFYWKKQLELFRDSYSDLDPVVYPGHGKPSDITLFDKVRTYIDDFQATIEIAKSRADAIRIMRSLYPTYEQADFLLVNSVNASIRER